MAKFVNDFESGRGNSENGEGEPQTRAKEAADIMGSVKIYLHVEGRVLNTVALETVSVDPSDIARDFGFSEEVKNKYKEGTADVYEQAAELLKQGKNEEAVALIKQRELDDASQVHIVVDHVGEISRLFNEFNGNNEVINGISGSLRKLKPEGKVMALEIFNQSFAGESTHNNLYDNRADSYVKDNDCYVIDEKDKVKLEAMIANLDISATYKIIEGKDPQVFILQIHNRNIPFICVNAMNREAPPIENEEPEGEAGESLKMAA